MPEDAKTSVRSSGATHGAFVQLGLYGRQVNQLKALSEVRDDDKLSLVRSVFGDFQKAAVRGGLHVSQNLVLFRNQAGVLGGYDFASEAHQSMSRQEHIGIHSHISATGNALKKFVSAEECKHAIVSWHRDECDVAITFQKRPLRSL